MAGTTMDTQTNWSNLPPHCLQNICSFKSFQEKIMQLVCWGWYKEISDEIAEKAVISIKGNTTNTNLKFKSSFKNFAVDSADNFKMIIGCKPKITYLDITTKSFEDYKFIIENAGKHIKELHICYEPTNSDDTQNDYTNLNYEHLKSVQHLKIDKYEDIFLTLLKSLKNLKKLEFCGRSYDNEYHESLKHVNPDLEELVLKEEWLDDLSFLTTFKKLRLLQWPKFGVLHQVYLIPSTVEVLMIENLEIDSFDLEQVVPEMKNLKKVGFRLDDEEPRFKPMTMALLRNMESITVKCSLKGFFNKPFTNLTFLELVETKVDDRVIELVTQKAPKLQTFILKNNIVYFNTCISINAIEYLSRGLSFLSRLEIHKTFILQCNFKTCVDFPKLQVLNMSDITTDIQRALNLRGDRVETLELANEHFDTDMIRVLIKNFPNLRTLRLPRCPKIIDKDISLICDKFEKLIRLECGSPYNYPSSTLSITSATIKTVRDSKICFASFYDLRLQECKTLLEVSQFFTSLQFRVGNIV